MFFLDSIGWSPASDAIVVYTYVADCLFEFSLCSAIAEDSRKLRVLLTLNSSDIAVIVQVLMWIKLTLNYCEINSKRVRENDLPML